MIKSKKKPRLLIVHSRQLGHDTGSHKIALHLQHDFEIDFICFDNGLDKRPPQNIRVHYVDFSGGRITKLMRIIFLAVREIRGDPDAFAFVVYFPLCFLIPLLSRRKIILDFRTGSIDPNPMIRWLRDRLAAFESIFFRRVSVISEGLAKILRIPEKKSFVLPLGADVISAEDKIFDEPRLFYIGTFSNRNLHEVINGISIALSKRPDLRPTLRFDVVGYAYGDEENRLKGVVEAMGLIGTVRFHGRLTHDEAKVFFDNSNIGVSYVPMTSYYQHQPPTKTYEYILSGMPVVATATVENARLVSTDNGVLCNDSAEAFSEALLQCIDRFPRYRSTDIRATLSNCSWDRIAEDFAWRLING
jgi:glycosyltransferase involved in cell wall biosynthesis